MVNGKAYYYSVGVSIVCGWTGGYGKVTICLSELVWYCHA